MYEINLEDCLDEIIPNENLKFLSDDDEIELYEMCFELMIEFVEQYPTLISEPNFEEIFEENIREMIHCHFEDSIFYTEDAKEEINEIINHCMDDFYRSFMPPRSYPSTIILNEPNIEKTTKIINKLRNIPQPSQRTNEWYSYRYNLITASNAYKVFESQSMKNQLIYEKCKPLKQEICDEIDNSNADVKNIKIGTFVNTDSTLHWGHKYEPLSIKIYEKKFNTKIEEFGCIKHDKYYFLGASPDGINVKIDDKRYGRILEIKNIVNREIDGIPKKEYWIQMQLQMEVCGLDECDFLETKFVEYENYEKFKDDSIIDIDTDDNEFTNLVESKDNKIKGIMIQYFKPDGSPYYDYMPFDLYDEDAIDEWISNSLDKYQNNIYNYSFIKNIYWKLEKISCVLVCRNKLWFNLVIKDIENIWKIIENERINGYDHRQPNKKKLEQNENEKEVQNEKIIKNIKISGMNLSFNEYQSQKLLKNNEGKCLLKISKNELKK